MKLYENTKHIFKITAFCERCISDHAWNEMHEDFLRDTNKGTEFDSLDHVLEVACELAHMPIYQHCGHITVAMHTYKSVTATNGRDVATNLTLLSPAMINIQCSLEAGALEYTVT